MSVSLKSQNKIALWIVVAANLAVYTAAVKSQSIALGDWSEAITSWSSIVPAGMGLIIVGVLNALVAADAKARLVFLRWRNPLPGCEAFTRHADTDARIDTKALGRLHGPLPIDPVEQNRLWYRLYLPLSSEPAVAQAHREYLFTRDYACLALMMTVVLGIAGFIQIHPWWVALLYTTIPLSQFLLAAQAARNHGRRLVQTVLAITCAQEKGSDR